MVPESIALGVMTPIDLATLIALAAVWGGSYLFIRVAVPAFGPAPLMGARVALAALVLWIGMRALGRPTTLRRQAPDLLVLGAVNSALPFTLIAMAEIHITASLAALLIATVPLFSAALSAVWLGERLSPRRAAGLALGVIGVGVLVGWSPVPLTPALARSIGAMLLAACSYAVAGVYTKRRLAGVPAPTLALGQQVGAVAWLAVPAFLQPPRDVPPATAIGAVAALAVVCTAFAFLLYFRLIARLGPTGTQTVTYIAPIFGLLWGAIFLHEPVTRGMLAGLACILLSVTLVNGLRIAPPRRARLTPTAAP